MIRERIAKLKSLLKHNKINGYIVPSNDEYMSEYTPDYAKRLEYITGFTGTNGIALIFEDCNLFFTDGRYLQRSRQELDIDIFKIFDLQDLGGFNWQSFEVGNNSVVGYDPKLLTSKKLEIFSKLRLQPLTGNLIDQVWHNQPSKPESNVYLYTVEFAGASYEDKINMCRAVLIKDNAQAIIITAADSICWLLNLRANDIQHTPLMLSLAILTKDHVYLFTNIDRIDQGIKDNRAAVTILPEDQLTQYLLNIEGKILVDENFASIFIMDLLANKEIQKINDPCQLLKACKNTIEIQHTINSHIKDAVAVCEFLAQVEDTIWLENKTEHDLSIELTRLRAKQDGYIMDSFPAICGFKENSAIIHYCAQKSKAKSLTGNGILLIDSGGQYMGATTDITRTISIGVPTNEQRKRYTQVLKGHIALSSIKFPMNITGSNLDVLARQFLWKDYNDYGHGTGHGVGSFLGVHEGPQNINLRNNIILQPGMVVSNEPGYYLPGKFGIRIENLMYVKKTDHPDYLEFETLSLVPYARDLIDYEMLTFEEVSYIKKYYKNIYAQIYHLLSKNAKGWLVKQLDIN